MGAIEEAVELKEKGNKAFKEHDWDTAISLYTKAIELNGQEPSFYTNRAQVSISRKHASNSHSF
jgi:serine/threonine-protein phosphatase 5